MKRALMAVGAHADDVELNVGGSLLKYRDRDYQVVYVQSTNNMAGVWSRKQPDGTVTRERHEPKSIMPQRKKEAAAGAAMLDVQPIHLDHPQRHFWLPDGTQAELRYGGPAPDVVPADTPTILTAHEHEGPRRQVVDLILEHEPEYIVVHGLDQTDLEHVGTCLLVTRAYWEAVEQGYGGGLLHWRQGFDWLGARNCQWDTFVDTSDYFDGKLDLCAAHACQLPDPYRPDFPVRRRDSAWGAANGRRFAEVFVVVNEPKPRKQHPDFSLEIVANRR